jgi:hypothetical protein
MNRPDDVQLPLQNKAIAGIGNSNRMGRDEAVFRKERAQSDPVTSPSKKNRQNAFFALSFDEYSMGSLHKMENSARFYPPLMRWFI